MIYDKDTIFYPFLSSLILAGALDAYSNREKMIFFFFLISREKMKIQVTYNIFNTLVYISGDVSKKKLLFW